jgi:hypothetical protein
MLPDVSIDLVATEQAHAASPPHASTVSPSHHPTIPSSHHDPPLPPSSLPHAMAQMRKVVFCSGKVYFDLLAARDAAGVKDVAITRIEQISPFPFDEVCHHPIPILPSHTHHIPSPPISSQLVPSPVPSEMLHISSHLITGCSSCSHPPAHTRPSTPSRSHPPLHPPAHPPVHTHLLLLTHTPFTHTRSQVQKEVAKYPNANVVWCQEEPKNGGAWAYVRPRIVTAARDVRDVAPAYAGRKPAASTATGYGSWHVKEMEEFIDKALN